jgi:hypothetical protein
MAFAPTDGGSKVNLRKSCTQKNPPEAELSIGGLICDVDVVPLPLHTSEWGQPMQFVDRPFLVQLATDSSIALTQIGFDKRIEIAVHHIFDHRRFHPCP